MKVFLLLIPLGRFVPLACMISIIPMPKEDQDETEAVSLLPKLFHTKRRPTAEDLWVLLLSEGIKEGQQCPMEGEKPQLLPWRLPTGESLA
jgi:hypothetical protein